jgi:hypothetical protein
MSFDLSFYKKENSSLASQEIETYLTSKAHRESLDKKGWVFQNQNTGVYFYFDLFDTHNKNEDDEEPIFDGFVTTGLYFNINLVRPGFFGREADKFLTKMCEDLDIYIHDPQNDDDGQIPRKYSSDELYKSYIASNRASIGGMLQMFKQKGESPSFRGIVEDISNSVWEYNFNREKIQEVVGDNCFAPSVVFLERLEDKKVKPCTTWANTPLIFPTSVHYFIGPILGKGLFGGRKQIGLQVISVDLIKNIYKEYLTEEKIEGVSLIRFSGLSESETIKLFVDGIKEIVPFIERDFKVVPLEDLVSIAETA